MAVLQCVLHIGYLPEDGCRSLDTLQNGSKTFILLIQAELDEDKVLVVVMVMNISKQ